MALPGIALPGIASWAQSGRSLGLGAWWGLQSPAQYRSHATMDLVMSPIRPSAVLWDFDGTLVDTEEVWIQTEIEVMARYGVAWSYEQGVALCGASGPATMRAMLAEASVQLGEPLHVEPDEFWSQIADDVRHHLETKGPPWLPGVQELVAELSARNTPMAVVSASPPELLDAGLRHLPPGTFSTVVSGPEMPRGKPAPDAYLMAAERLGIAAFDCIVVEDSLPGTAAGRASGAVVIAVPGMVPLPTAPGQVNLDTLAGLTADDLSRIWHEVRASG